MENITSLIPPVSYYLENGLPIFSISTEKPELFWWGVNSNVANFSEEEVRQGIFKAWPGIFNYKENRDEFWSGWVDGIWYAKEYAEGRPTMPSKAAR